MRKYLSIILFLLLPIFVFADSISPTTWQNESNYNAVEMTFDNVSDIALLYNDANLFNPIGTPGGVGFHVSDFLNSTTVDFNFFSSVFSPPASGKIVFGTAYINCDSLSFNECILIPEFINYQNWTYTSAASVPSGSPVGIVGSAAPVQYGPRVEITSPEGGVFSSAVEIKYSASDENDALGLAADRFGLGSNPISIYYSDTLDILPEGKFIAEEEKNLIAEQQPASGSFLWDIGNLPDGDGYRIIAGARDKFGDKGEVASAKFSIDRSPPTFNVGTDPSFSRGEDVKIVIEPSEELLESPALEVKQRGLTLRRILTTKTGTNWEGNYQIVPGFDGPAEVFVSGKDKAGNKGNIIAKGGIFSVGIEPPPKPIIVAPLDKDIITQEIVNVKGQAREDTEITLILNGKSEYKVKPDKDGNFIIENVRIDTAMRGGINFLKIISGDAAGNLSEAASLSLKFNISPEISIISPKKDEIVFGTTTLKVLAVDKNNDKLFLTYEVSQDNGINWTVLASNIIAKQYGWITNEFPDGDYLARLTVSDGAAKTVATSSSFKVKNFLPNISFADGSKTVSNTKNTVIIGKVQSPSAAARKYTIKTIEFSLNGGETWISLGAEDGSLDSFEESFALPLADLKEGRHDILFRTRDSRQFFGRAVKTVIVDFGPPTAPLITSPKSLEILSNDHDLDSEMAGVQFEINGKSEASAAITVILGETTFLGRADDSGNFKITATLRAHGRNDFKILVTDLAGNKSPEAGLAVIYNNPPLLKFLTPREGRGLSRKTAIKWQARDLDLDSVSGVILSYRKGKESFRVLARNVRADNFVWDVGQLREGTDYTLKLEATDGVSANQILMLVIIDNTPPIISAGELSKNVFTKTVRLDIRGEAADNLSGIEFVEFSLDGKNWFKALVTGGFLGNKAMFSLNKDFILDDGRYKLLMRAVDAAGNVSAAIDREFLVDTKPPRVGSFQLSHNSFALLPAGDIIHVIKDVALNFIISLEKDTKKASLFMAAKEASLLKNNSTGLWEAEVLMDRAGTSTIAVSAEDALGNIIKNKIVGQIVVIPRGRTIAGSKIIVFSRGENQSFSLWPAASYGAENPIYADEKGEFVLLLPAGTYQILAEKTGYQRLRVSDFEILNPRFINFNFELSPRRGLRGVLEDILEKISF